MLAVNIVFAGLVLALNGYALLPKSNVDKRVQGTVNAVVGALIAINATITVFRAGHREGYEFAHAAGGWLFTINYFIIAAHIFFKSESWKGFGFFSLFATIFSLIFAVDAIVNYFHWIFIYMWFMWALLWFQSFLAMGINYKEGCKFAAFIGKLSAPILIINGIASTFIPGILMLLGVI